MYHYCHYHRYKLRYVAQEADLFHDVAHWGTLVQQPQLASLVGFVCRVAVDSPVQHRPVEVTNQRANVSAV